MEIKDKSYAEAYGYGFHKAAEDAGVDLHSILRSFRKTAQHSPRSHARSNIASELAGNISTPLLIYWLTKDKQLARDTTRGGLALGSLAALLTDKRSHLDQAIEDSESHLLRNLLIPGVGAYNMYKRLGSTIN